MRPLPASGVMARPDDQHIVAASSHGGSRFFQECLWPSRLAPDPVLQPWRSGRIMSEGENKRSRGSLMAVVSTTDPQLQTAIRNSVRALRRIADYTLPPDLDRYIRELGERKEFLSPQEHEQLLALVSLTEQRSIDKLQAELALQQLQACFPNEASA
jgi:hypothetical protein